MSKCDIRIEFDVQDRTYSGGETITGRVFVRVNEAVKSKGISLTHYWRTHGRGNVASGPKETIELESAKSYAAGEEREFAFSLTASTHPITYHGTLINLDHYVLVQMDVPWSFNPKAEEEYLLKPGQPPQGFVGSRDTPILLKQNVAASSIVGRVILFIFLLVVLAGVATFAIFLLPILLIVAGFVWFRRGVLALRLGEVKISVPHVIVAPGEQWTARVQFQPRRQVRINSIGLTLLAKEVATSGSGTSATTHRHTILERKAAVRSNETLTPREFVSEDFTLAFPATEAFSLDLSDNKVQWTVEVRIDIPAFPDWSKTQPLQVVPPAFLKNVTEAPTSNGSADNTTSFPPTTTSFAPPNLAAAPEESDDIDDTADAGRTDFSSKLLALVASLNAAPRYGSELGDIVANVSGQIFDVAIVIDRVTSLMDPMASDSRYDYGKSVTGSIQGTNQSVQVLTPESQNDQIDDLRRGDVWRTQIVVMDFDSLYSRINARQVDALPDYGSSQP